MRIAYRQNRLAHSKVVRVAESYWFETTSVNVDSDDSDVHTPINAYQLSRRFRAILENDLYVYRVFNYMRIGHNMSIFVDNKAGSTSDLEQDASDFYGHD